MKISFKNKFRKKKIKTILFLITYFFYRSSSKKTLTDLTDSGVSVVSDTPPVLHGIPAKDQRVLAWVLESDKGGRGITYTHSEMSMKHRNHRDCTTSPNANRYLFFFYV